MYLLQSLIKYFKSLLLLSFNGSFFSPQRETIKILLIDIILFTFIKVHYLLQIVWVLYLYKLVEICYEYSSFLN